MSRYFYVEFFNAGTVPDRNCPDHNAIVSSFEELASLCEGRTFLITGEATLEDYQESKGE